MMTILNIKDADFLARAAQENFRLQVNLDILSKFIFFLTFRIYKGVEFFALGTWESRIPFMFIYGSLINVALHNSYRVIIKKEGQLFKNTDWYLEFVKK
ncbi:MAG: hypothetical protein KJ571_03125 [Bacteroidetes bacterium]|nr:hypothetical protein [Bacteroidota bacterium]